MKTTNTAKETMKQAIKDMVKELNLKQCPTIKITEEEYVMAAGGFVYTEGMFNKIITKTESDYVLRINKTNVNKLLKRYAYSFYNKQAAYDCLYLLICHELRHMYQYQEQFLVGKIHNGLNIDEMFDGHGASPAERDANNWMIKIAESKGMNDIAYFMELEQRADGLSNRFNTDFHISMTKAYIDNIKHYNKPLYHLHKFLKK